MESKLPHKGEKGQVGIGTLIVFIAMVLVAAIAAGVLINTAGFLQSSAEQTGQGASEQTTNRVDVAGSVTGSPDGSSGIGQININVKRESGAGNIDLSDATIQFVAPDGVVTLTAGGSEGSYSASDADATASPPVFGIGKVKENGDDTSIKQSAVLNDDTDVAKIRIQLDSGATKAALKPLETGESATLTLTTDAGGETEIRVQVPDTIQSSSVTLSP